jgi:asparagine synthase (glutamine-hydrolysing)
MCGIAGFWQTRRLAETPSETLASMAAALVHRGPDDAGAFHDAKNGIGLAFRRLSILDLSPEGHQPMFSESGRYVIVFNGEVYNFEELRTEIGGHWRGHSDTEVMLAAIEKWGLEAAVQRFVGMFAFALYDQKEQTLSLVRDRVGIKPLYYGRVGGDFVFASELKAIFQYPEFDAELDRDALALYLRHDYIPTPYCVYKGFFKLTPGCILTLRSPSDECSPRPFWSAESVAQHGFSSRWEGSEREALQALEDVLKQSIRLRMIADVPLGAFLSGGIDSSTVVALMQEQATRPVKTFTIGFDEKEYDEAAHARSVAAHLGTEHTELHLRPQEALEVVPLLPAMFDEPFADSSAIPTYLVSKLARTSVTVGLSGDGGDEVFGGYTRYLLTRSLAQRTRGLPLPVARAVAGVIHRLPVSAIENSYGAIRRILPEAWQIRGAGSKAKKFARALETGAASEIYFEALSHWTSPSDVVLGSSDPETLRQRVRRLDWVPTIEEQMMLIDLGNYLPDDVLTKVDRASMQVSLEARVPILDHRVIEFAWSLPLHMKIRSGVSKWALRQVLYKRVPPELIERPKMGFGMPLDNWLRGPLKPWAEELLSEAQLRKYGVVAAGPVRDKWREHLSGRSDSASLLWSVLMLQSWLEKRSDRKKICEAHTDRPQRIAAQTQEL